MKGEQTSVHVNVWEESTGKVLCLKKLKSIYIYYSFYYNIHFFKILSFVVRTGEFFIYFFLYFGFGSLCLLWF